MPTPKRSVIWWQQTPLICRAQAPGPETASQVVMMQWEDEGDDGEDESPLIIRKRKGMTKIEAEPEIEVVVEPHSSPVETAQASQAKRVKTFVQKRKTHEVPLPRLVTSKDKERRWKRVRNVNAGTVEDLTRFETVGSSPTPALSRASIMANPRIHELAEKPGSSLHVVLQTVSKLLPYGSC
ncbi:hypothetical protein L3X38_000049 [Prunus dulcis]|uniref:Uncharacterized protein n=1 Tax=Prunus dulcis TaxID=3755 RepID=A0AAD4UP80_PRUDU|nr:hypothetical protein L3X38_000049 [Prunus dulcis]